MSKTVTTTISVYQTGDGLTINFSEPASSTSPNTYGNAPTTILTVANTFVAIPVSAQPNVPFAVTIVPPPTNASALTLKGVTGDTGIGISPSQPTCIALAGGVALGIVGAASNVPITLLWG
jgi:hypothetical protein